VLVDLEDSHQALLDGLTDERIGGRYVVERVLGVGGMGLVAAARYPELDQEVAIKFMRPELAADPTLSARFLREARLAARAKSVHFVRVFDFGRLDSGVPYLVMEMLSGRDLGAELLEQGPLSVEVAVDYVLQAAVGLAEIHALGVVHRDLKPANLFLAEAAGARTIKVLDLGLSTEGHGAGKGITTTGHSFGTPHYMSPEQIRESKAVDARSDVWSLGIILFELLTAALPFGHQSQSTGEVFGLILHTEPIPPRHYRPDLSEDIEAVILRCLHRDPAGRYADLGELAEALRGFTNSTSASRPDAVRAALATRRVEPAAVNMPFEPTRPSPAPGAPLPPVASPPQVLAATTPNPRPRKLETPPFAPTLPVPEAQPGSGSKVSATSGPSATSDPPAISGPPGVARRPWLVPVALAGAVVGVGAIVLLARTGASPSAGASVPTPIASAAMVPAAAVPPTPSAPLSAAPIENAPVAPASATPAASQPPAAAIVAPRLKPAPSAPRPGNRGSSVLDGLDRK
jgi:eukaryotic-like serine/threonine-protein kinase